MYNGQPQEVQAEGSSTALTVIDLNSIENMQTDLKEQYMEDSQWISKN